MTLSETLRSVGQWANDNEGIVAILLAVASALLAGTGWLLKRVPSERFRQKRSRGATVEGPVTGWLPRLNALFHDSLKLHLITAEPKLVLDGPLALSGDEEARAEQLRSLLKVNDPVAVLSRDPLWADTPVVLHLSTTDYASVSALDACGKRPTIVSANAVVVCEKSKELVLHRRGGDVSRDYPGALHTFGGAYIPPEAQAKDYDRLSLIRAACREVHEESGLVFSLHPMPPMILGREHRIGFVHLALIGVNVSPDTLQRAESNHEGEIVRIPWDDLFERLIYDTWVPAGKAQILSWLALGAPVDGRQASFSGESGQQLFNRVVP